MTKMGRIIVIFGVIAAGAAGLGWWRYRIDERRKSELVVVDSARIQRGDIRLEIQATGKVQPYTRLEVKPPISGRIEEVKVDEGQTVRSGGVLAIMSSSDRAAMLDLARAKGTQAVLDMQDVFRPTPIIAPISGTVIAQNIRPGQTVAVADIALILSDRPVVVAEVDETDIGSIKLDQEVRFTLDAYPNQDIEGKVEQIAYESKTINNVTIYEVKIAPTTVPAQMRSGMTAAVHFQGDKRQNVLIIPTHMIQQHETSSFVFLSAPASTGPSADEHLPPLPLRRDIRLGLTDGKRTEVLAGLSEGDEVIILAPKEGPSKDGKNQSSGNPFMPKLPGRPRGGPPK